MSFNFHLRFLFSVILIFSLCVVSFPVVIHAQTTQKKFVSGDLQTSLSEIEKKIDERRTELGIPGISLAIVKDGRVILAKGFGYRDFENKLAVTPDTQFPIGSTTKAFTALSVLMSHDEGKLTLDDNPKKYLPFFKINNAEIDKNVTIRNLLSHSTGLSRTDLAMLTGKLNRSELIKVAGIAKPTARLGEKFQYQNIMFTAAGEIVSVVQKQTWEKYIADKILKPLNMTNTDLTVAEMRKTKNYSQGYEYNPEIKEISFIPTNEIGAVSPSGAINSSANDMAKWLKFVLNKGEADGKRLVSEKSFDEWLKPQMKITPDGKISYGLGWVLQDWKGLKVASHGGNKDGFTSTVALIPEKNLGFVMLTNVAGSSLPEEMMPFIWEKILGKQNAAEIKTVSDVSSKVETNETKNTNESAKELIGIYASERNAARRVEVAEKDGAVSLVLEGQPPYQLLGKSKDIFKLNPLHDAYGLKVKRDESGKITGIFLVQPQGEFLFNRLKKNDSAVTPKMSVEELMTKVIDALGGEENLRKINSRVITFDIDFVNQGVNGYGTQYAKAPNQTATETNLTALGKPIGMIFEYFDGTSGGRNLSFLPAQKYGGKRLKEERIKADFYGLLNWKKNYKKTDFRGTAKVGGEDAYVVVFQPEHGSKTTVYFSQETFLPLKFESSDSTANLNLPYSETYGDYRSVDGVMIPFKIVNTSFSFGETITTIREIKQNIPVDEAKFHSKKM